MRQTLALLERLMAVAAVDLSGRLVSVLDPDQELSGFNRKLELMRLRRPLGEGGTPPKMDMDPVRQRWVAERPSLSGFTKREVRALCWDPATVADRMFVERLSKDGLVPQQLRLVRGLWHAHQLRWRTDAAAAIEKVVTLKASEPVVYGWIAAMKAMPEVASPTAPAVLAREVRRDGSWRVQPVLDRFGVTRDGALGKLVVQQAVDAWLTDVRRRSSTSDCEALVEAGHRELLSDQLVNREELARHVSVLLELVAGGCAEYRNAVITLIREDPRLGHPARSSTQGNWVHFTSAMRSVAIRLFAAKDLKAFFEILIGANEDEQQRRRFWERYVESPQLMDFAIACNYDDRRKLKAAGLNRTGDVASLDDAPHGHSAFVIRFKGDQDIIIAEMSKAGNAMYLYTTDDFESGVGMLSKSRFDFRGLKDQDLMQERWRHAPPPPIWHERFESQLRMRFGVHPGAWT